MFKHILLPTDGSPVSDKAIKRGVEFAKKIKARVTALHVVPDFRFIAEEGITPLNPVLKKRFQDEGRTRAKKILEAVAKRARARCPVRDPERNERFAVPGDRGNGQAPEVRSHHDGLARTPRPLESPVGQRNFEGADPFQGTGAGGPIVPRRLRRPACERRPRA
jgi:nucleotide-binding universal stress UspA family protein